MGGRGRVLRAAGLTLAGALLLGIAAAGWLYRHLDDNITGVDIDTALGDDRPARATPTPSASPQDTGPLTLLVLGSDSRGGAENAELGGGDSEGARSDTAMVVRLDAGRTTATVVSIPRDTLVTRPSCPRPDGTSTREAHQVMFNTAYAVGGPVCAVKTVEAMTDVRIDHFLEIDFSGFAKLVDALGGVTVTVDEDIDDDKSHLKLDAGTHHLDGTEALGLARTRYGTAGGSDLARVQLQQRLVKALLGQISGTDLLTDPARLYRVADAVTGGLTTDTGLDSPSELIGLGRSLGGLSADAVRTVTMPVVPAPSDSNRVVADEPAASELWKSLR
ncbi:LCP family protein [Streptomyces daghestanicus]|uniref:Transcriptional regulator n=1 Tax=Streptomyces daghestanicus TaxID=66885 RepID=A0ABQ3Q2K1_9ACTN|nr:LCP family protein [Streptomyces daghestanicus]GGU21492.1 transcriptional regulator [Streptomyces daghestanicus]GHI31474.1 transcriptional regulator [Streptomyces daghestanicus]